jgi:hypothetical protein
MKPYIYLIFDKIKSKPYYVGKHIGINKNYITGGKILKRYINIFGLDTFFNRFDRIILEHCELDVLEKKEEFYIKKYKTKTLGGNLTWGGRWDVKYRVPKLKPVLQYDLDGNFLKEWKYQKEPFEMGIVSDYGGVSACCLGKQITSCGFIWRFKKDVIEEKIEVPNKKKYKNRTNGANSIQIIIDGVTYQSKAECRRITKFSYNKINNILKKCLK